MRKLTYNLLSLWWHWDQEQAKMAKTSHNCTKLGFYHQGVLLIPEVTRGKNESKGW